LKFTKDDGACDPAATRLRTPVGRQLDAQVG